MVYGMIQGRVLNLSMFPYSSEQTVLFLTAKTPNSKTSPLDFIDFYHGAAILNFFHWYQCYQSEAGRTK